MEATQLECLSDASFLGKPLVLPANVRLDWKVIVRYKHSSLFGLVIRNERKKFYNIDTWCRPYKAFVVVTFLLLQVRSLDYRGVSMLVRSGKLRPYEQISN